MDDEGAGDVPAEGREAGEEGGDEDWQCELFDMDWRLCGIVDGTGEPDGGDDGPAGDGDPAFRSHESAEADDEGGGDDAAPFAVVFEDEDCGGPDPDGGEEDFGHDGEAKEGEERLGDHEEPECGDSVAGDEGA